MEGLKVKKMYKIIGWMFLMFISLLVPCVTATRTIDVPIVIGWNINEDSNGTITSIIIYVNSSSDTGNTFSRTLTKDTNLNDSRSFDVSVNTDASCTSDQMDSLTQALLESNREVVLTLNNSFNVPKQLSDCLEGRARIAENNIQFQKDRDSYKNSSDMYQNLYNGETTAKDQFKTRLDGCNTDLLTRNTDFNTCNTELDKTKKKPIQYAIISILITVIAINMYNKSKEPTAPEMFQFNQK